MFLAECAVFIDFDGTLTPVDTGVHLLERLAQGDWRSIEEEYKSGRIGSRVCMERQWALLPADRRAIEAAAREIRLDPAAVALVEYCRSRGAEVTIVSDGYGFRAREAAAELDVAVLTNHIDWTMHKVVFAPTEPSCPCGECGTCKRAPVDAAKRRGKTTVLVGDGVSDIHGAHAADVVFAKGELADRCSESGIPFTRWDQLSSVVCALQVLEETGGNLC